MAYWKKQLQDLWMQSSVTLDWTLGLLFLINLIKCLKDKSIKSFPRWIGKQVDWGDFLPKSLKSLSEMTGETGEGVMCLVSLGYDHTFQVRSTY